MTGFITLHSWMVAAVAALAGIAMSAICSALEMGLYTVNSTRLELRAHTGDRRAMYLRKMLQNPNRLLSVLLIGNNCFNYAVSFAVSFMVFMAGAPENMVEFYVTLIATGLLFVLGESIPKNIARALPEKVSYGLWWALWMMDMVFLFSGARPLLQLLCGLWMRLFGQSPRNADLGLSGMIEEAHASGVITSSQSAMAGHVMSLGDVCISDVMQPKNIVVTVPYDADDLKLLEIIRSTRYSRLPVLSLDGRFTGIVDIYDVLADGCIGNAKKYATPPMYVNAADLIAKTLYDMQKSRRHIAVVLGKNDEHIGIVTIKDLVEEIVGEIREW